MSNKLSQVTYTDDGSGFVAHVTYDGAIGPPAIPLNDSAIGGPAPIPFQEDQQDPPPEPVQPVAEPLPQDLDVIVAKGQEEEEEDEADAGDKNHPVHNMFFSQPPQLPVHQPAHQLHLDHLQAHHVHQQAHQLHLDHNQLHALHLLQPQLPALSPSSLPVSLSSSVSLFDSEPAAILARGNNPQLPQTPNLTSPTRPKKQPTRVVVRRRPAQLRNILLQRQPLGSLSNNFDLSQFTLLGVGRVLG